MPEITVACPHCRAEAAAPAEAAGRTVDCPSCGKSFAIPPATDRPKPICMRAETDLLSPPPLPPSSARPMDVVVTDVRIPFWSMVVLIIKWALAAIPAMIILVSLWMLVSAIFVGGCAL